MIVEESNDVALVRSVGRGSKAQEETRGDVSEDAAIGGGFRVVRLIEHDVVETLGGEPLQVLRAADGLNGGNHNVGVKLGATLGVPVDPKRRLAFPEDEPQRLGGLPQQLLAMGQEEHARRVPQLSSDGGRVEGGEVRLAEAGRHHDESAALPLGPRERESVERLSLNQVRLVKARQRPFRTRLCTNWHYSCVEHLCRIRPGSPPRARERCPTHPEPGIIPSMQIQHPEPNATRAWYADSIEAFLVAFGDAVVGQLVRNAGSENLDTHVGHGVFNSMCSGTSSRAFTGTVMFEFMIPRIGSLSAAIPPPLVEALSAADYPAASRSRVPGEHRSPDDAFSVGVLRNR